MTTVPPETPAPDPAGSAGPRPTSDGEAGPRISGAELRDVARIRRTTGADRWIGGVAGGLARHLDVDPTLLRVGFVVLTFFGGAGLLLYGALWLLVPEEGSDRAALSLDERSLKVAVIGAGVLAAVLVLGDTWGGFWLRWPVFLILLIAAVILASRRSSQSSQAAPLYQPYQQVRAYQPVQAEGTDGSAAFAETDVATPLTSQLTAQPGAQPGFVAEAGTAVAPTGPGQPVGGRPSTYLPPPRPRDPRKRGPILFWFTLALVALGIGLLGMVDVSGVDVPGSAYPALATAIVGLMLLVGAFFGRAGGLILLGLLTTAVMIGTAAAERVDTRLQTIRPTTAGAVSQHYSQAASDRLIDLSEISNPEDLDGKHITIEGGAGRVVVIVPEDVDVTAKGSVGAGSVSIFDAGQEGLGVELTNQRDVPQEVATFSLDVQLGAGEIEIRAA